MARFLPKLLLLTLSLGFALVASELVVRSFYPVGAGSSFEFRIPHPVLGWSLQPGASYTNRLAQEDVRVRYNSQGFHDVEHALAHPEGKLRVLVLGDSYMEAYSVHFSDSFHARLAEQARQAGVDLEVINMGVGGYGTLQEYLIFQEIGRHYDPDLVLLAFYPNNDVANNSIELERKRSTSGIKIESRPFLDIEAKDEEWRVTRVDYDGAQSRYQTAREARRKWRFVRENSALLRFTWARMETLRRKLASSTGGTTSPLDTELANLGVHRCNEHPAFTRGWELTRRSLDRLASAVENEGAELVVFNVPGVLETDPAAAAEAWGQAKSTDELCFEQAQAHVRLRAVLAELGIPMIDLLGRFRSAVREEGSVVFREDGHWGPIGHAIAAGTVFEELRRLGLLATYRSPQRGLRGRPR